MENEAVNSGKLESLQELYSAAGSLLASLQCVGIPFSQEAWRNSGDSAPVNSRASVELRSLHRAAESLRVVMMNAQAIERGLSRGRIIPLHIYLPLSKTGDPVFQTGEIYPDGTLAPPPKLVSWRYVETRYIRIPGED